MGNRGPEKVLIVKISNFNQFANIFRLQEGYVLVIAAKIDNLVQEICKNLALCGISKLSLKLITTESSENIIYVNYDCGILKLISLTFFHSPHSNQN